MKIYNIHVKTDHIMLTQVNSVNYFFTVLGLFLGYAILQTPEYLMMIWGKMKRKFQSHPGQTENLD